MNSSEYFESDRLMGQPDQDMHKRGYGLSLLVLVYVIKNGGHKAKLLTHVDF